MSKRRKHLRAYTTECGGKRNARKPSDAKVRNNARINTARLSKKERHRLATSLGGHNLVSETNWVRAHVGAPPERLTVVPEGMTARDYLFSVYK